MTHDDIRQRALDAGYNVSLPALDPHGKPWATMSRDECAERAGWCMLPAQHEACRERFLALRNRAERLDAHRNELAQPLDVRIANAGRVDQPGPEFTEADDDPTAWRQGKIIPFPTLPEA
jgi:hypothetical protein